MEHYVSCEGWNLNGDLEASDFDPLFSVVLSCWKKLTRDAGHDGSAPLHVTLC